MKPEPAFIIGFDTEWVTEPPDPVDDVGDPQEPGPPLRSIPVRNRILSYQLAARFGPKTWSKIYFTGDAPKIGGPSVWRSGGSRLPLGFLLGEFIAEGMRLGHLRRWPQRVVLAAHWTRADLSSLLDYPTVKREFDGVQKTYATLTRPYRARVSIVGHRRQFDVFLVDTQLLAPGSSKSLWALGDLYNFPKIDLGQRFIVDTNGVTEGIPYIRRMDWLLVDDPALFEKYAIRDAEICARHFDEMLKFTAGELGLPANTLSATTLGSIAVDYLLHVWEEYSIDPHVINGIRVEKSTKFSPRTGLYRTRNERKILDHFARYQQLAVQAFHGGRNETFYYGPTVNTPIEAASTFREYDLISAYATALAAIAMPDYENLRATTDPDDFDPDKLGFARVRFRFPEGTRVPSLPVRAADERGLIYPLEGTTYATAPEIAAARHQGATIDVLDGVIIPWHDDGVTPFKDVIAELIKRRERRPSGTLQNAMYKQLANSLYGKLAQGLKGATGFNTRTGSHEEIRPSRITNPYLAAHVTGLIRALIGELIASIPPQRRLISVTTDGFITDSDPCEIDVTGPVARYLGAVRCDLTGSAALLETKFEVTQLLPWRTRGIATLEPCTSPKLARGGMREPSRMSPVDANNWFVRSMLLRQPGDKWSSFDPLPFPTAHQTDADHVLYERERAVNFEYDMKRRPVDPSPCYIPVPGESDLIVQHLRFSTVPWRTVDAFNVYRDHFEKWRHGRGGQLKTIADWRDWRNFDDGADASKAGIRRSRKGLIKPDGSFFGRMSAAGGGCRAGVTRKPPNASRPRGIPPQSRT